LSAEQTDVVVTFGAGNIDAYCQAIADALSHKA
jgi:UDP-N-acetylmuramate-alanine ligase